MTWRWPAWAVTAALLLGGCSPNDVVLRSRFATGFDGARHAISVLGVFKDGRLSPDAWGGVAGPISQALGGRCVAGYSDGFVGANPDLSLAIDDYARANGPTDDLLTTLSHAATGDIVLVLTVAGHPPVDPKPSLVAEAAHRSNTLGHRRAGDPNRLDISALLFSVREARSVGVVELDYGGSTMDDALARFAAKLAAVLPGTTCAGWAWEGKVSAAAVLAIRADGD